MGTERGPRGEGGKKKSIITISSDGWSGCAAWWSLTPSGVGSLQTMASTSLRPQYFLLAARTWIESDKTSGLSIFFAHFSTLLCFATWKVLRLEKQPTITEQENRCVTLNKLNFYFPLMEITAKRFPLFLLFSDSIPHRRDVYMT